MNVLPKIRSYLVQTLPKNACRDPLGAFLYYSMCVSQTWITSASAENDESSKFSLSASSAKSTINTHRYGFIFYFIWLTGVQYNADPRRAGLQKLIAFIKTSGTLTVPWDCQNSWKANTNALRCLLSPHFLMA